MKNADGINNQKKRTYTSRHDIAKIFGQVQRVDVDMANPSKNNAPPGFLYHPALKIVLGLCAAGSFALAFGGDKVASLMPSADTSCLAQFYRETPPALQKESLQKNSYPLCFNGFSVMYSGVSKTPLWSAEHLYPARFSQKLKRENNFHEETRIDETHRSRLADYKASGYDRGHMSPNADMSTQASQFDSFSLANMVPQAPKNNQEVWRKLEEATRALVTKQKQNVYVVTGPVFEGQRLKTIGQGVIVPTAVFKAIYLPESGAIGVYYAPNNNSQEVEVISVCQLEEKTGINIFPQLSEEQKRNVYKLPLTATEVSAQQKMEYAQWDAQSQCANEVGKEQIQELQQKFQQELSESPSGSGSASGQQSVLAEAQHNLQENLIQRLLHWLVQFILQFFKAA